MKEFFKKPKLILPKPSLEEEAINTAEAYQKTIESDKKQLTSDRVDGIMKGIEDIKLITKATVDLTEVETQMFDIIGQMAVAGTDADPAELLPTEAVTDSEDKSKPTIKTA